MPPRPRAVWPKPKRGGTGADVPMLPPASRARTTTRYVPAATRRPFARPFQRHTRASSASATGLSKIARAGLTSVRKTRISLRRSGAWKRTRADPPSMRGSSSGLRHLVGLRADRRHADVRRLGVLDDVARQHDRAALAAQVQADAVRAVGRHGAAGAAPSQTTRIRRPLASSRLRAITRTAVAGAVDDGRGHLVGALEDERRASAFLAAVAVGREDRVDRQLLHAAAACS